MGIRQSFVVLLLCCAAAPAGAIDGVIEINQASTSGNPTTLHIISAAGSYRLTSNLVVPALKDGILISADDVTLDLNGFTISSLTPPGTIRHGILAGNRTNIEIRNGTIRGFPSVGIYITNGRNHRILDVRVIDNATIGMNLESNADDGGFLVRGCTAWSNGDVGIRVLGAGSLIIGNVARANGAEGIFMTADNGYAENVATGNVGAQIQGGDAIGCNLIGTATVCPP